MVGFVPLEGDVEIRSTEAKSGNTRTARVRSRSRPLEGFGGNEKRDVGPVDGGVGRLKVRTWGNGSMVKRHDGLHDARNARSRLQVTDLRFDGSDGNVSCACHAGPQAREGGEFRGVADLG